jgi:hypothetical protein
MRRWSRHPLVSLRSHPLKIDAAEDNIPAGDIVKIRVGPDPVGVVRPTTPRFVAVPCPKYILPSGPNSTLLFLVVSKARQVLKHRLLRPVRQDSCPPRPGGPHKADPRAG